MGQVFSHNGLPGGEFYVGPIYATSLSHDRQTEVRIDKWGANGAPVENVQIGPRAELPYLQGPTRKHEFFKRLGLVVKTRGSRLMHNAEVVITDYYRLDGRRFVARDHAQGPSPANWTGIMGPAEASAGLRMGDTLYAINHRLVVNKSKGQVLRQLHALLEKNDGAPVILTWKHTEDVNATPWELEIPLSPPQGVYVQLENEWGPARPTKISSVSI